MLQDRNIALFIDVDNCGMQFSHYENVMNQVADYGAVIYGKIYGATEKRHKEILSNAEARGFDVAPAMRLKRRGVKAFDNRILQDVVTTVYTNENVDAVVIVAAPADMVYLYSMLRRNGIKIIACDNVDEDSLAFVDEFVDLGKVEMLKLPTSKPKKLQQKEAEQAPAKQAEPAWQPAEQEADDELLKEIELLKSNIAEQSAEEQEPAPDMREETDALLKQIEAFRKSAEQPAEQQPAEVAEQPAAVEQPAANPAAPSSDDDLIGRIEEIRSDSDGDDDELIEKIKKLLDGLD